MSFLRWSRPPYWCDGGGTGSTGSDGLSPPFRASRDNRVLGVLPTVCVAMVLEVFVPVLATGRAETPGSGIASLRLAAA